MSLPTISVIIPCYNAEAFLREAIESALSQTRTPVEVIVVDDVSTDKSVDVARSFGERITLLVNAENAGPGASRNRGARNVKGEYLAFLDADDRWDNNHLEHVAALLDQYPEAGVAFSKVKFGGAMQGEWPPVDLDGLPRNKFLELVRNNQVHLSSAVVRKRCFDEVDGFQELVEFYQGRRVQAEDYDFVLRVALRYPLVGTNDPTAHYRMHASQSSFYTTPQVIMGFKYRLRLLEDVQKNACSISASAMTDRIQMAWQEYLEQRWSQRDSRGLQALVKFGRTQLSLSAVTQPYMRRARFPGWAISLYDFFWSSR